jgi:hypothetical protein
MQTEKKEKTIFDIIKIQIKESEEETIEFENQETHDNISDLIARRTQKERGFKI